MSFRPSRLLPVLLAGIAAAASAVGCGNDLHLGSDTTAAGTGAGPGSGGGGGHGRGGGGAGGAAGVGGVATGGGGQDSIGGAPPVGAPLCSSDGWCWELPKPQGNVLYDVKCFASDDFWAVGDSGTILHNDGTGWTRIETGLDATIVSLSAVSPHSMFAVSDDGHILHYDGSSWSITQPFGIQLLSISALADDDAWALEGGPSPTRLLHFDGTTWSVIPTPSNAARKLLAVAPNDVYLWELGTRWILHYDGVQFHKEQPPIDEVQVMLSLGPHDIWIAGETNHGQGFAHYDGTSWTPASNEFPQFFGQFETMWGTSADDLWAFDDYTTWHWQGIQWAALPRPIDNLHPWVVHAACALSPDTALGVGGFFSYWDGATWKAQAFDYSDIRALWGSSASDVIAAGWQQVRFDGTTWNPSTFTDSAEDAGGTAFDDQWLVGSTSNIDAMTLHWDGATWNAVDNPFVHENDPAVIYAVWDAAPGDVWIGGTSILAHYDGSSWVNDPIAANLDITGLRGFSSSDVWAVAGQEVFHYDGNLWTLDQTLPTSVEGIWPISPDDVWAVGDGIYHYDGTDWTAAVAPAVTLHRAWASGPTDVYTVGDKGVILHYDGVTWTRQESGTRHDLFSVWGSSAAHVLVSGTNGSILTHDS